MLLYVRRNRRLIRDGTKYGLASSKECIAKTYTCVAISSLLLLSEAVRSGSSKQFSFPRGQVLRSSVLKLFCFIKKKKKKKIICANADHFSLRRRIWRCSLLKPVLFIRKKQTNKNWYC